MLLIGITGGVGAGKTSVLNYIRQNYSCRIELADEVAHKVKEPGEECYNRLVELMGEDILCEDQTIDKGKMAAKIFADADLLEQVNECIHPAVKEYLLREIEQERNKGEINFFFIEAALLIEAGYKEIVDEMWYIYASEEVRSLRLQKERGYTVEKITQIMDNQLEDEEFRAGCDFVIDNSNDLEDTYRQIDKRLKEYVI